MSLQLKYRKQLRLGVVHDGGGIFITDTKQTVVLQKVTIDIAITEHLSPCIAILQGQCNSIQHHAILQLTEIPVSELIGQESLVRNRCCSNKS